MSGRPPFAWEPDKGAYIGVMPRDGTVADIRWFRGEACYVFHPMNAWEEGDQIVADVMQREAPPLFPAADGSPIEPEKQTPGWSAGPSTWRTAATPSRASSSTTARRVPALRRPPRRARQPPQLVRRGHRARCRRRASTASPMSTTRPAGAGSTSCRDGDATSEPVFVPRAARLRRGRRLAAGDRVARGGEPQRSRGVRGDRGRPRTGRDRGAAAACRSACTATGCRRQPERGGGGWR